MHQRRVRRPLTHRGGVGKGTRFFLRRKLICALLMLLWGWLLGFLGVVVYFSVMMAPSSSPPVSILPDTNHHNAVQSTKRDNTPPLTKMDIPTNSKAFESPTLIFTCTRDNYLKETLDDLYTNIPKPCQFGGPIIVSEDGSHAAIQEVVQTYKVKFEAAGVPFFHIQHPQSAQLRKQPYVALAQHYGWALGKVFDGTIDSTMPPAQRVIILEEDLHTSPDFFEYMEATANLLDNDPTLFAVSAFNDNGHLAQSNTRLLRSDFFPGLGWMMTRKLWKEELETKWPQGYWDDWLREPAQRKGREIIHPEFSRTFHFGVKGGASSNQFGNILTQVKLNSEFVSYTMEDLSYLDPNVYEAQYGSEVMRSTKVFSVDEALEKAKLGDVWLEYNGMAEFKRFANACRIMDDEKAGIPRTAYHGIVEVRPYFEYRIFLTPPEAVLKQKMQLPS